MLTKYKGIKKKENKNKFDYSLLVDTAILLGEIMLKNGVETNRVEEAMDKLLRTTKMKHIEAVVMTTSIVVTLSDPFLKHITAVSRIHDRITNLNRVNIANSLVNEYCNGNIDLEITKMALDKLKVDCLGLDETDYNLLLSIIEKFNGGPVGIEALAASIGEEVSTIEDVYEPYLLQNGYLKRTNRGRVVTEKTYEHLGIKKDSQV